jgi:hypothetical protein
MDESEIKEDRERCRKAVGELRTAVMDFEAWAENPDGIPPDLSKRAYALLAELCRHVGHSWMFDQCGWVDHAFCLNCNEPLQPDGYAAFVGQVNGWRGAGWAQHFSPPERRRGAWVGFVPPLAMSATDPPTLSRRTKS